MDRRQGRRGERARFALVLARAVTVAGLAGLSGCITPADRPDLALDLPFRYRAQPPARIEKPPPLDWWRTFRSRELTALMEEAQTVNLDVAAARARIVQADASARIVGAALLPAISAGSTASEARNQQITSSNRTALLSASYEIDFWGKNRDAALAAEDNAAAFRFDRDVVALSTLASVGNAYFQVLAAQDRIRVATENIASASRIFDAIRARFTAGTGTELDVAQQESVLANLRASVPPLRQIAEQNKNALALLVSRPPQSVRIDGGSLNSLTYPRITPGLPSALLAQRPDIRRQEAQLASATASVGSARAQFFPTIALTGQGGTQSAALSLLLTPQSAFYNAAVNATQPIFDGGRIQANFELTRARQDELLQSYRKSIVQAFTDVDNALVAVRQTGERLRLQRQAVAASQRAFALAEQQLRAGTADIVTVLNTQLTLFNAQDVLIQVQLLRYLAMVSLYQALGGGWMPAGGGLANAL